MLKVTERLKQTVFHNQNGHVSVSGGSDIDRPSSITFHKRSFHLRGSLFLESFSPGGSPGAVFLTPGFTLPVLPFHLEAHLP